MALYNFTDGAYCHTLNISSAAWVLYSPAYDFVSLGVVIGLLTEAASQDVRNLVVLMDSQLVVCHLNHVYTISNHVLFCLFQTVLLLERSFETITYRHIPRECNAVADSLANYILD